MRVAVTGSRGLVGSHVAAACTTAGWDVVALDRCDGFDVTSSEIASHMNGVAAVLHCAAPGNIHAIERDRLGATRDHCVGSVSVVEAASRVGARVVAASSWEVYSGGPPPVTEATGKLQPSHFYGALKLASEHLLLGAADEQGVPATNLRIGTVWASAGRKEGVIPLFIDRASRGLPLTVQGSAARQFTRAEDVASAFILAAEQASSDVLNVVAPEVIRISTLAERIAGRFGVPIVSDPAREHDAESLEISSDLAREELGWHTSRSFWDWLDREVASTEGAA